MSKSTITVTLVLTYTGDHLLPENYDNCKTLRDCLNQEFKLLNGEDGHDDYLDMVISQDMAITKIKRLKYKSGKRVITLPKQRSI